jgi:type III pantothenate kinase
VNRPAGEEFLAWLEEHRAGEAHRVLAYRDLDLRIDLPAPERVGIDRLLAALAVNRLRETDRPAVIADLGTAIKVDAVSAGGAFLGGAILPGIRMSARALQQQTDLLPDIELVRLEQAPEAVGKSTNAAIHSGLFWGAVGAIRELVARYTEQFGTEPLVVLAGGAAPAVARLLRQDAIYEPHLVLSGIAISALAEPGAV